MATAVLKDSQRKGTVLAPYLHLPGLLTVGYGTGWEVSQTYLTATSTPRSLNFLGRTSLFIFTKKRPNAILSLCLSRTLRGRLVSGGELD